MSGPNAVNPKTSVFPYFPGTKANYTTLAKQIIASKADAVFFATNDLQHAGSKHVGQVAWQGSPSSCTEVHALACTHGDMLSMGVGVLPTHECLHTDKMTNFLLYLFYIMGLCHKLPGVC